MSDSPEGFPSQEVSSWLTVYPAETPEDRKFLEEVNRGLGSEASSADVVMFLDRVQQGETGADYSKHQKKLLGDVYRYMEKGVPTGIDDTINRQAREASALNTKEQQRTFDDEAGEWEYRSGYYRGPLERETLDARTGSPIDNSLVRTTQTHFDQEYKGYETPGDVEHFFKNRIDQLFAKHPDRPVTMVDFGAMYGTTLLHLAEVYEKEINEGKLVLVGTNLAFNADQIEESVLHGSGWRKVYPDYLDKWKTYGHLIKLIEADAEELVDQFEPGSIDIIHESWTIAPRGDINEIDYVRLASLLSEDGVLALAKRNSDLASNVSTTIDGRLFDPKQKEITEKIYQKSLKQQRMDADRGVDPIVGRNPHYDQMVRSANNLFASDLNLVELMPGESKDTFRDMNYSFWVKKGALPLELYDNSGKKHIVSADEGNQWNRLQFYKQEKQGVISRVRGAFGR